MNFARFHFRRVEDNTGVSGTGRVAEGVQFSDGTCAVRWLTEHRSSTVYASITDVVAIHGHGGKTLVVFEECPSCAHTWKHHWMDNCGGCDVHPCQCAVIETLPAGCVGEAWRPEADCLCSPRAKP